MCIIIGVILILLAVSPSNGGHVSPKKQLLGLMEEV